MSGYQFHYFSAKEINQQNQCVGKVKFCFKEELKHFSYLFENNKSNRLL